MPAPGPSLDDLDKTSDTIRDMFGAVAPRYDLLNHLLSAFLDVRWRRLAAAAVEAGDTANGGPPPAPVLDLCCGTGDQAVALARRGLAVAAADFCLPMLAHARRKYRRLDGASPPSGLAADALALPFPAAAFAAVTVSFGLRNLADLDRGLAEIARVLRPGGRVSLLEFAVPRAPLLRAPYLFYFRRVLPALGGLISARASAYRYLRDSVLEFPQRDGFTRRLAAVGFDETAWRDLSGGIVALYTARRAA